MSILSTTLLALSQSAGVGGLALGVYNYLNAKKMPRRTDQRGYRKEVRELLFLAKRDCEDALRKLKRGDDLPEEQPESIANLQPELEKIALVLDNPISNHLRTVIPAVMGVTFHWGDLAFDMRPNKMPDEQPDAAKRRSDALRTTLREDLDTAIKKMDDLIRLTIEADKGP